MNQLDWILLTFTLLFIILYGIWKNRHDKNLDGYLLGNQSLPWYHVGLSVMATQASAITFLSAPGQAFTDGMRFVQFYFGLPLAMIVLCITFVPIFHRLKVYTAYEYLQTRFDSRVRILTAFLFLLSRGLSTGISIYAPSIILSTILGWDIMLTNVLMGGLVLTYTIVGGTKAISYTHLQQMIFVTLAMVIAGYLLVKSLPPSVGFSEAMHIAKASGKMNTLNFSFDWKDRYNVWSGLIGGFFLQLSYFGTDQSQVSRYLTGQSIKQSRMGLIMNGLLKIPMQFGILMMGVLLFIFYGFSDNATLFANQNLLEKLKKSSAAERVAKIESEFKTLSGQRALSLHEYSKTDQPAALEKFKVADAQMKELKTEVKDLIKETDPTAEASDVNYIFLDYVLAHLPHGLIGLLIAVIFSASMGSIASAYNSLASTTMVDIYYFIKPKKLETNQELYLIKSFTVIWGVFCILVAMFANRFTNSMIELVNILGSWFYGVILGIFCVAFYIKSIKAKAVFWAALVAEAIVIYTWKLDVVAFLWLNPLGCLLVIGISYILNKIFNFADLSNAPKG